MDAFDNELMKAEENEEDVNELNDVTFGDSLAANEEEWEWEKESERMAVFLKTDDTSKEMNFLMDYDDGEGLDLDDIDLKNKLNQLFVDDDDDEEGVECVNRVCSARKPVDLDELFGPSSPPGLFSADEMVRGLPNIWGSPIRESHMKEDVGGLKSLLRSLQKNPSVDEGILRTTTMQPNQGILPEGPVGLPMNAKMLEDIEKEMILGSGTKTCWRVEELEKGVNESDDVKETKAAAQNRLTNDGTSPANHHPSGSPALPPNTPHTFMRMPLVNPVLPTMPGVAALPRSPFPVPGRGGQFPIAVMSPLPGQRHPGHWNQGSNTMVPMVPPHVAANNMNYMMAARAAAAGYGFPHNRHIYPRMPGGGRHPGMNPMSNMNHREQQMTHRQTGLHDHSSSRNQHLLLQQQQQLLQQQHMLHQHPSYRGQAGWPASGSDYPRVMRREEAMEDEYAGLMEQREKDWIIKIQLLQLQTDNPYVDDYYFTCWSIKKMQQEKQKKEGTAEKDKMRGEPTLVLPQLAKVESKVYTPVQFEGSLGRLTASSIHNPRQIIDFHLPSNNEHEDGHHLERKRFKELLLEIEKGYNILLEIDDIEKKALAQPPDARTALYDHRKSLIKRLYQRIQSSDEEGDNNVSTRLQILNLVSIHKGLLLAIRLLPLLEKVDAEAFCCALLCKLPLVMKKDWQQDDWPRFYQAISQIVQTADLNSLVRFATEINTESCSKNRLNSLMSVVQNKLGISLLLALVSQGEVIYATESPLDLDAELQSKWRKFIELVADALENLSKDMLERPLERLKNITDHFTRFLDKRQILAIEDKLDVLLLTES